MPFRRKDSNEYYICLECGAIKPWYNDLWCRTCGGKVIGPIPKETAEEAKSNTELKKRIIKSS